MLQKTQRSVQLEITGQTKEAAANLASAQELQPGYEIK